MGYVLLIIVVAVLCAVWESRQDIKKALWRSLDAKGKTEVIAWNVEHGKSLPIPGLEGLYTPRKLEDMAWLWTGPAGQWITVADIGPAQHWAFLHLLATRGKLRPNPFGPVVVATTDQHAWAEMNKTRLQAMA